MIVQLEKLALSSADTAKREIDAKHLKEHIASTICVAYCIDNMNILLSTHRGLSDGLFLEILERHLQLYYEDPNRKDIPTYLPIDKSILEKRILNLYPMMDKFSPIPCFNFPLESPSLSNNLTTVYYARHDRVIVSIFNGSVDPILETTPLVIAAIVHTSAYLTQMYNQKQSKELCSFIAGYNEMRPTHIPGYSGISLHQVCNVLQFASGSPSNISKQMFHNAYRDRISHRLSPEERLNGVCHHSLDINFQVDLNNRFLNSPNNDCGRLTNLRSWGSPVVAGAMVVDLLPTPDLSGLFCSIEISHTIPKEIRKQFIPLLLEELGSLDMIAFDIANR